jgi:hypothetical protein
MASGLPCTTSTDLITSHPDFPRRHSTTALLQHASPLRPGDKDIAAPNPDWSARSLPPLLQEIPVVAPRSLPTAPRFQLPPLNTRPNSSAYLARESSSVEHLPNKRRRVGELAAFNFAAESPVYADSSGPSGQPAFLGKIPIPLGD